MRRFKQDDIIYFILRGSFNLAVLAIAMALLVFAFHAIMSFIINAA